MEIMHELLVLAQKDINKTRLMYQTNLCYTHFIKYMDFLLKDGFLGEKLGNPTGKLYHVTEKGLKFIEKFNNVLSLMK